MKTEYRKSLRHNKSLLILLLGIILLSVPTASIIGRVLGLRSAPAHHISQRSVPLNSTPTERLSICTQTLSTCNGYNPTTLYDSTQGDQCSAFNENDSLAIINILTTSKLINTLILHYSRTCDVYWAEMTAVGPDPGQRGVYRATIAITALNPDGTTTRYISTGYPPNGTMYSLTVLNRNSGQRVSACGSVGPSSTVCTPRLTR